MARYRKIEVSVWHDARFCGLSAPPPNAQTLWLYLLSGPRTTSFPGLVVARAEVVASDLGWSVEAFREAFSEASAKGMAKADWKAGLIVLQKALIDSSGEPRESAKPESPNVLRSWSKSWDEIPDCDLKIEYLRTLEAFAKGLGGSFQRAFREAFRKALAKELIEPCPNQEQEQEQNVYGSVFENRPTDPVVRDRPRGPDPTVLEFSRAAIGEINRLSGRNYEPDSEANMKLARSLVKRKRTIEDAMLVIRSKRLWIGDAKMGQFFRPATLLGPENFAEYLDDARAKQPMLALAAPPDSNRDPEPEYGYIGGKRVLLKPPEPSPREAEP